MGARWTGQVDRRRFARKDGGGRAESGTRTRGPDTVARIARAREGFTLIELMIVVSVLLITLVAISQSLVASLRLTGVNRETALATDGIRERIEILEGAEDFSKVFALYNSNPNDDPGGAGTAPGSGFAVRGLPSGQIVSTSA